MTKAGVIIGGPAARQLRVRSAPVGSRTTEPVRRLSAIVVPLFILSLALPIIFYAGSLRLSPYRVILIATFIPCVIAWVSGRAGILRSPDFLILLSTLWAVLALAVNNGASITLQTGGALILESFGSYLLARCLIRDRSSFEMMVRLLFLIVVVLLPFALLETLTGRSFLLELFPKAFTVFPKVAMQPRFGFHRAQVSFEHPILFGVFCSSVFGLVAYVNGKRRSKLSKIFRQGLIALATACSLSAAALLSLTIQSGLMAWQRVTRGVPRRWGILGLLFASAFLVINVLSTGPPLTFLLRISHSIWAAHMIAYSSGIMDLKRSFDIPYSELDKMIGLDHRGCFHRA